MEDVTILVKSETKDIKEQPIRVRAWVSDVDFNFPSPVKIYAEVKKGYHAIVDASVIASVGRPQGDPWIMRLTDNGAGKINTSSLVSVVLGSNPTVTQVLFLFLQVLTSQKATASTRPTSPTLTVPVATRWRPWSSTTAGQGSTWELRANHVLPGYQSIK